VTVRGPTAQNVQLLWGPRTKPCRWAVSSPWFWRNPLIAAGALRRSGLLVFTVEHTTAADIADIRLELHGRYSHSDEYVHRVLEDAGLCGHIQRAHLRTEAGEPVAGLVVRAAKTG
jgi:predicted TPR repeat methyltransferase